LLHQSDSVSQALVLPVSNELSHRFMVMPTGERTTLSDIEKISKLVLFIYENASEIHNCLNENRSLNNEKKY
jgi:hypothetical protein